MAQVKIRALDDDVVTALKHRAATHGHSLEQELRDILTAAVRADRKAFLDDLAAIRSRYPQTGPQTDSVTLLREDRDR